MADPNAPRSRIALCLVEGLHLRVSCAPPCQRRHIETHNLNMAYRQLLRAAASPSGAFSALWQSWRSATGGEPEDLPDSAILELARDVLGPSANGLDAAKASQDVAVRREFARRSQSVAIWVSRQLDVESPDRLSRLDERAHRLGAELLLGVRQRPATRTDFQRAVTAASPRRNDVVARGERVARNLLALNRSTRDAIDRALGSSIVGEPGLPGLHDARRVRIRQLLEHAHASVTTPRQRALVAVALAGLLVLDRLDPLRPDKPEETPVHEYLNEPACVAKDLQTHLRQVLETDPLDDSTAQRLAIVLETERLLRGTRLGSRARAGRKMDPDSARGRLRRFLTSDRETWFTLSGLVDEASRRTSLIHGLTTPQIRRAGDGLASELPAAFERATSETGPRYRAR